MKGGSSALGGWPPFLFCEIATKCVRSSRTIEPGNRILHISTRRKACNHSRVLKSLTFLATPTTGRILGEWGADVIKVEAFKGDPCRVNQAVVFGMPSSDEENLAFDVANFHKRFVALNLKTEKGLEVMMKLLAEADVFITNTRTKSLAKMGLDWETLHEKFPRLIMGHGLG